MYQTGEFPWLDTRINSNIGFETRVNNGSPEWRERGADTWSPFKSGIQRTSLGNFSGSSTGTATFSAKGIEDYNKLTTANFGVVLSSMYVAGGVQGAADAHVEKGTVNLGLSYNQSTGVVTLTGLLNQLSKWNGDHYYVASSYVTGTLYCYH